MSKPPRRADDHFITPWIFFRWLVRRAAATWRRPAPPACFTASAAAGSPKHACRAALPCMPEPRPPRLPPPSAPELPAPPPPPPPPQVVGCYVGCATVGVFAVWYTSTSFLGIDLSGDGHTPVTLAQLRDWEACRAWKGGFEVRGAGGAAGRRPGQME